MKRISLHQLDPEVSLAIAEEGVTAVVFVDTRVDVVSSTASLLRAVRVAGSSAEPQAGHHMGPSTVMAYARLLYGKDPIAWVLTVPGVDFDHGEGFSDFTQSALDGLHEFLASLPLDWPERESLSCSNH